MLKLHQVSKYYRSEETVVQALRRVSLTLNSGEFVVITGESGSGKSTLLNVISGLDTYEEGELSVNGEETSYYGKEDWENYRSQYIGFIFQNYNIIDSYTVYQNVMAALTIQGYPKAERKNRALQLIDRVDLSDQLKQKSSTLSGGQKQRVAIARALAKDAPIIVADEPTGNLDKTAGKNIISLLKEISQDKLVVMVTHNYEEVKDQATRRIRLFDGEVVEDKTLVQTAITEARAKPLHEGMRWSEKIAMAFRNLLAMPKRLVLTLLISMFIVAVFSFSYGSYIQATSAFDVGSYNPFFNNNHPSRLIVLKRDQTAFSNEEIATFQNMARVREVITFDPVLELRVSIEDAWNTFSLLPASTISRRDLQEGRLPTQPGEIVVSRQAGVQVGDTIRVGFDMDDYRGERPPVEQPPSYRVAYEVVGIHSGRYNYNFYLHGEDLDTPYFQYRALQQHVSLQIQTDDRRASLPYLPIRLDNTLAIDAISMGQMTFQSLIDSAYLNLPGMTVSEFMEKAFQLSMAHPLVDVPDPVDVSVSAVVGNDDFNSFFIAMHPTLFEQLFVIETSQITLVVEDSFDADRVRELLDRTLYHTIYPAEYQPMSLYFFTIFERLMSFIAVVFQLAVMYFLTYLALRNIMRARKRDYVIYRSIGATQKDLNHITIIELMAVFFVAFVNIYLLLVLNATLQTIIPDFLRFYSLGNYLFVITLLLALAFFLGLRFNRKIFKDSVITALRTE